MMHWLKHQNLIVANWDEPERAPHWSWKWELCLFLCIISTSFHIYLCFNWTQCHYNISLKKKRKSILLQNDLLSSGVRQIPYSRKHSRVKTFTNFVDFRGSVKLLSANWGAWFTTRGRSMEVRWIHESFFHEILVFTDSWKFSPSKVSRYTVGRHNIRNNRGYLSTGHYSGIIGQYTGNKWKYSGCLYENCHIACRTRQQVPAV